MSRIPTAKWRAIVQEAIRSQERRGWLGAIITNPNCATAIIALALAPLAREFGIERVVITTMQAVSGTGNHGITGLDILGNVVPNILGEEDKICHELPRLLGAGNIGHLDRKAVIATTCRVPVVNGHTVTVVVDTVRPVNVDAARVALARPTSAATLPSSLGPSVVQVEEADRPQPRLDAQRGGGMSVSIGRLRAVGSHTLALVACGDDLVRGAAGAALLNAELLHTGAPC